MNLNIIYLQTLYTYKHYILTNIIYLQTLYTYKHYILTNIIYLQGLYRGGEGHPWIPSPLSIYVPSKSKIHIFITVVTNQQTNKQTKQTKKNVKSITM